MHKIGINQSFFTTSLQKPDENCDQRLATYATCHKRGVITYPALASLACALRLRVIRQWGLIRAAEAHIFWIAEDLPAFLVVTDA